MKTRPLRIGFDFDGVIAYNPVRIVRPLISTFKRSVLGVKKLTFFYPRTPLQRFLWILAHESSIFPSHGSGLFKTLVREGYIEAHLVTARFSFLDNHLKKWLKLYGLDTSFATVTINQKDEQPHLFKEKTVVKNNFDYFIDDNLDIVLHLDKMRREGKFGTEIHWVYNILDRNKPYPHKHPDLKNFLESIPLKGVPG